MKPDLILHPGFPKCATSAIQRAFVLRDHELAARCGVAFLGRDFVPNAGYPPVIKLMDDPEACVQDIHRNTYDGSRYLLSNEALLGSRAFIKELGNVFNVISVILTIRFPIFQSFSNYRYSGWVTGQFSDLLGDHSASAFRTQRRMGMSMERIAKLVPPPRLCPLEVPEGRVVETFCNTAFGDIFGDSERYDTGRNDKVNTSVGLAFAEALSRSVRKQVPNKMASTFKRDLVIAAKKYELPRELDQLTTPIVHALLAEPWKEQIEAYLSLLDQYGTPSEIVDYVSAKCNQDVEAFLAMPVANSDEVDALTHHADNVVRSVLTRV